MQFIDVANKWREDYSTEGQ